MYFLANWKYRIHTVLNINKTILFWPQEKLFRIFWKPNTWFFRNYSGGSISSQLFETALSFLTMHLHWITSTKNNVATTWLLKQKCHCLNMLPSESRLCFFLRESKDLKASNWNWHCLGTGWRTFFSFLAFSFFPAVLSNSNFWKTEGYVLKPASM